MRNKAKIIVKRKYNGNRTMGAALITLIDKDSRRDDIESQVTDNHLIEDDTIKNKVTDSDNTMYIDKKQYYIDNNINTGYNNKELTNTSSNSINQEEELDDEKERI